VIKNKKKGGKRKAFCVISRMFVDACKEKNMHIAERSCRSLSARIFYEQITERPCRSLSKLTTLPKDLVGSLSKINNERVGSREREKKKQDSLKKK